ncbi:MAG: helix-hairpin-helix domain-containing protein, partial [Pirellulales bacterium]|nr:helix-hairpin-helix domain-containing protein [Pirellulales bacterium]
MTNARIAEIFDEIADLLEFQGANAFRGRAYRRVGRAVHDLAESVESIIADDERDLTAIDGIGKDTAAKIVECVETGKIAMREELLAEIPESVLALLRIPGLGPKKAAVLHRELGIDTLDQLEAACNEQRVRELKGFGAKTEEVILKGIGVAASADERIYWVTADEYAQALLTHMSDCSSVRQLEMAGSYRRGKETVGDLDVLVDSSDHTEVMDHFGNFESIDDVIA